MKTASHLLANILNKLDTRPRMALYESIIKQYRETGFLITHFVYFASLAPLFNHDESSAEFSSYHSSLMQSDFLLPDGIALSLIYERYLRGRPLPIWQLPFFILNFSPLSLPNHNGTDFVPGFLKFLSTQKESFDITLLSAYDERIGKPESSKEKEIAALKLLSPAATFVRGYNVDYQERSSHSFRDVLRKAVEKQGRSKQISTLHILLVATGSPHQERWCEENRSLLEESGFLVFSIGGLIDFITGQEKRAPIFLRKLHLEWLYRSLSQPKKNKAKAKKSMSVFSHLFSSSSLFD